MGYVRHNAIIATGWQSEAVDALVAYAANLGAEVLRGTEQINGYITVCITPDGSKEGWSNSEDGDARRKKIREWLNAAEYIAAGGNENIIFCERGIRTYETFTRNTLDLSAVAAVKELSHLPIIVDPSHGTGRWQMVRPMARAAIAAGADGLIIEVHPHPEVALSDGNQSLTPKNFNRLMEEVKQIGALMGKAL